MRTLTTLVLALAAAAPAAQVGDGDALFVYHLAEHLEAVRAERVAELRAAYAEAAPERRSAAEAALLAGVDPGRPALRPPDFDALARARRALLGEAAPAPALDELAESLDLRVVPGCFAARAEGRGEATTVAVTQLWRAPGRDADVTLWWTRGEERERARSEPVAAASFAAGFEMYVRPPVSTPGRWALVAELRAGDASAWSRPVAVECVDDLAGLRARVAADASLGAGAAGRAFATRFERLFALGVRSAAGVPLARQLELLAGRGARPVEAQGAAVFELADAAPREARRGLLLAATPGQAAVELVDPAWSATGAATERRVFAAALDASPHGPAPWLALVEDLCAREGLDEVIVVARGELGLLLPAAVERAAPTHVAGLVLVGAGAPAARASELPTLRLGGAAGRADVFAASDLPGEVAAWLRGS